MRDGLADFLAMGGYAMWVWPAYGLATLVLGGLVVVSLRTMRRRERALRALDGAGDRRRAGDR